MLKWPWENVQDFEAINKLTQALEENNKAIEGLRSDMGAMVETNIHTTQAIQDQVSKLHEKTGEVEQGLQKTAEAINHIWYLIHDPNNKPQKQRIKRFVSWSRDFISHHHLLIVSWFMFAVTIAGAAYIFLSSTGAL
jgi:regulator of replication initiation timing